MNEPNLLFMKKIILLITIGLFYSFGQAQNDTKELKDFELNIRTSNEKIILESKSGSAWQKLTFSLSNLPQAIDEYGMTALENGKNKRQKSESTLADYTFTIEKTADKIILKGIQGTSWKELTYDCSNKDCASQINELGMM